MPLGKVSFLLPKAGREGGGLCECDRQLRQVSAKSKPENNLNFVHGILLDLILPKHISGPAKG